MSAWRIAHNTTATATLLAGGTGAVLWTTTSRSAEWIHEVVSTSLILALSFQLWAGGRWLWRIHAQTESGLLNAWFGRLVLLFIAITVGSGLLLWAAESPITQSRWALAHRLTYQTLAPTLLAHIGVSTYRRWRRRRPHKEVR